MKRRILIFCLALSALGLTAFGVINWKDSEKNIKTVVPTAEVTMNMAISGPANEPIFTDFIYDVGPRFSPMKKTKLDNAKTINDFFDEEVIKEMKSLKSVNIVVVKNERPSEIHEIGYSNELTEAQLKLLETFGYSSNFSIRIDYEKVNTETGMLVKEYSNPHLTIVPEKQAEYSYGKEALMGYLRVESKEARANVDPDKLRPAKLYFTVNKLGNVENVRLDNHSGYPEVDKKMIKLISNLPGSWKPAKSTAGEKVNQELVVSFGLLGC